MEYPDCPNINNISNVTDTNNKTILDRDTNTSSNINKNTLVNSDNVILENEIIDGNCLSEDQDSSNTSKNFGYKKENNLLEVSTSADSNELNRDSVHSNRNVSNNLDIDFKNVQAMTCVAPNSSDCSKLCNEKNIDNCESSISVGKSNANAVLKISRGGEFSNIEGSKKRRTELWTDSACRRGGCNKSGSMSKLEVVNLSSEDSKCAETTSHIDASASFTKNSLKDVESSSWWRNVMKE